MLVGVSLPFGYISMTVIGSLVMYFLLFLMCLYALNIRSSLDKTASLYFTTIVASLGSITSLFLLISAYIPYRDGGLRLYLVGLFFGMTLTPLTWMVGITLFSAVGKERKPLLVKAGYIFALVQFALIIVTFAFFITTLAARYDSDYANSIVIFSNIYFSTLSVNWVFFLLFFALVIQYRQSVTRKVIVTLIVFGILNVAKQVTQTVYVVEGATELTYLSRDLIAFFFTDFISVISLCISIFSWKNLHYSSAEFESLSF